MLEKYKYKIIKLKDLVSKVGMFPRKDTLILCHGVFDIVHPGHVRHLSYAKSKAKILVVSITADKFVKKGRYRPHLPENLRALNLAAFEMIDFVFIDDNEKPLELIEALKPEMFAKGHEYSRTDNFKIATLEEKKILDNYGGKIIFTPGDIVYSSSNILNNNSPNISIEKLLVSMKSRNLDFESLKKALKKINGTKVHIVGDLIIDSYTRTTMIGGQTKTPTLSVLYNDEEKYIGGAGIVAKHLNEAGADVTFTSVVGDDELGHYAYNELKKDIKVNFIFDKSRPTTNKNVFISGNYRLLKVDKLDNRTISEDIQSVLKKHISKDSHEIVIFSDFRHGIFNRETISKFTEIIPDYCFRAADSQVASRWGNITEFKKFDLITPNEREARFALADQDSTVGLLAESVRNNSNAKHVFLKLGDKGLISLSPDNVNNNYYALDSFTNIMIDPVGAGDALLAYSTLVLKVTNCFLTASIIGSIAAACECEKDGNIPITKEDIISKIRKIEKHF